MRLLALWLAILWFAPAAQAAVVLESHVLQKGVFLKEECTPDSAEPNYNECKCEADISYPALSGMSDEAAQTAINSGFLQSATKMMCKGQSTTLAPKEYADSSSYRYESTFESKNILGLKFTHSAYGGGAHENTHIESEIIDLKKGKMLAIDELFAAKDLPAINDAIYDTLAARPEGEVLHDQVESHKKLFLDAQACHGCSLMLFPDGIHVVFQTYEVAPYSAGNTEVPVAVSYIAYTPLREALTEKK